MRLRSQALRRLRDELATWKKVDLAGPNADQPRVGPTLAHWRADPDLAGVRDPEALAGFPAEEHAAWKGLWRAADELRRMVEAVAANRPAGELPSDPFAPGR